MTQDAEPKQEVTEMTGESTEFTGAAVSRFMKSFQGLCRSHEDMAQLEAMVPQILGRWGGHGCDMVAALLEKYQQLDLNRLKNAVHVFVHTSTIDFQFAVEEFWWLMGVGKGDYMVLLADERRFEDFGELMKKEGLDACKKRAVEIRGRIDAVTGEPG